jgi:deoxyribonuclease V
MQEFIKIQEDLAKKVVLDDGFGRIEKVAGVDLAYDGNRVFCAAVVLDYESLETIKKRCIKTKVKAPYIPNFLAFREAEPIVKVVKPLKFDILMLDGHGIAHPRGIGVASHVGVLLEVPTIGVAKRILCGEVEGKIETGKPAPLIHENRQIGYAYRTKDRTNPIYISPGHKVSLEASLRIVKQCIKDHKLPEPTRLAHVLANFYRRK